MTALRAIRGDAPGSVAAPGPRPDAVTEDGAKAPAALLPAPVPAPPLPAGLDAGCGTRLVAGLTWEIATGPEIPVLGRDAPPVLRLPARRARLAGAEGCGSLLLAMAAGLARAVPDAEGPWAFLAELPSPDGTPRLWMAVADIAAGDGDGAARVTPRPGPEGLPCGPDAALAALRDHLATTDVAGLAVRWIPAHVAASPAGTCRGPVIQGLAAIAPDLPLHDVEPDASPAFAPPLRVPLRPVCGLAAGTAALLAGVLFVLPAVQPLLQAPPPPPPETVAVAVAPGAFARACAEAADAWWPRVTGWRAEGAGCAVAGHLPASPVLPEPRAAERLARPMVAWRRLVPDSGRNGVLARAAAEQAVAAWPHEAAPDGEGLTFMRTAALPLVPAEADGGPADPARIRARLAALWADAPDAVTGPGETGPALFSVGAPDGLPTPAILARADGVPGVAPVRLVRTADGTELVLAPVVAREVPLALVETAGAGGGQAPRSGASREGGPSR